MRSVLGREPAVTPLLLSVVIPGYNEAQNVPSVVRESVQTLETSPCAGQWEIILVNDGSQDDTDAVMDEMARQYESVRVIHHKTNRGFGAALKTGYAAARGTYVTLISADGEIGVDQPLGLLAIAADADLVISERVRPPDATRTLLTILFNWLTRQLTGFDPAGMGGIYVIRRELLQDLELTADTGVVNYQLFMQCLARRCRIARGVTEVRPRLSGTSKVTNARTMARVTWELFKLRGRRWHKP